MAVLKIKLVLGVTGVVALFVVMSLVQEMNRRWQVQREVRQLEEQANEMQQAVTQLENLNQYFRTDDYQERLAREKLNYQAPGEKVVLIPDETRTATAEAATPAEAPMSIPEKWWRIFFVPERE